MRIYRCDKCGFEDVHTKGIVGHNFDHHGFETLEYQYRRAGLVDLCAKCFKQMEEQVHDAARANAQKRIDAERKAVDAFARSLGNSTEMAGYEACCKGASKTECPFWLPWDLRKRSDWWSGWFRRQL